MAPAWEQLQVYALEKTLPNFTFWICLIIVEKHPQSGCKHLYSQITEKLNTVFTDNLTCLIITPNLRNTSLQSREPQRKHRIALPKRQDNCQMKKVSYFYAWFRIYLTIISNGAVSITEVKLYTGSIMKVYYEWSVTAYYHWSSNHFFKLRF